MHDSSSQGPLPEQIGQQWGVFGGSKWDGQGVRLPGEEGSQQQWHTLRSCPPFSTLKCPSESFQIYASKIAGGQVAYNEVRKMFTYLSWAVWSPPPQCHHTVCYGLAEDRIRLLLCKNAGYKSYGEGICAYSLCRLTLLQDQIVLLRIWGPPHFDYSMIL